MPDTLALAEALISRASVTPVDAGCLPLLAGRLEPLGFRCEPMRFGDVDNLWACRGKSAPLLCFAGHTDVVPPGPAEHWHSPPFEPSVRDGKLFGRGAADMKGSLAAMTTAIERFIGQHPAHRGTLAVLFTSDEEGPARDGTLRVVQTLQERGIDIDWCIVGEPSSTHRVGDTIKVGRRGSLSGLLTVTGVQGHVAYPHRAENPVHTLAPALAELCATRWDEGHRSFPPTSFQMSNIRSGAGVYNVIPGELEARFNFRFCPATTVAALREQTERILDRHGVNYTLQWRISGLPFETRPGPLLDATVAAVKLVTGDAPELSTSGGTSDGRFIAPTGAQVVELGLANDTIHKVNECTGVADLEVLSDMYYRIMTRLLT